MSNAHQMPGGDERAWNWQCNKACDALFPSTLPSPPLLVEEESSGANDKLSRNTGIITVFFIFSILIVDACKIACLGILELSRASIGFVSIEMFFQRCSLSQTDTTTVECFKICFIMALFTIRHKIVNYGFKICRTDSEATRLEHFAKSNSF